MKGIASFVSRVRVLAVLIAGLAGLGLNLSHATDYQYDDAGRLVSATNDSGETARYLYDSLGNIVRIERSGGAQVTISALSPNHGTPGTQVTINGSGFGATTSENAIYFNGVSAPILASSSTQLLAMVPFNATSGPVTVVAPGGTAVSAEDFYISTIGDAPVITSVAPTIGPLGTIVTISGEHLSPIPGQTSVRLNGVGVVTAFSDDQQITVTIPPYVGSGYFEVTTAFGAAYSTDLFYLLPTTVNATSVTTYPNVLPDSAPQNIAIPANRYIEFVFDGQQGDYLSLLATNIVGSGNTSYSVTAPSGSVIASGNISATSPSVHLPRLPVSGSYSVLLGAGTTDKQLTFSLQRNPAITIDGEGLSFALPVPAQSQRLFFAGVYGENLGLGISGLTLSAGSYAIVYVYLPDGSAWINGVPCYVSNNGCDLNLISLPKNGVYSVVVAPASAATMTFSAMVSHELTAALAADAQQNLDINRRGQNARLSFQGVAGTVAGLQFAGVSSTPASRTLSFTVISPTGKTVFSGITSPLGEYSATLRLTESGPYAVFVDPQYGAVASAQVTLISNAAASATIDGDGFPVATTVNGQSAYFTFTGTAGENLGLGISGLTVSAGTYASVYIQRPDGSTWYSGAACYPSNNGCDFNLTNLPASGVYSVVVVPGSAGTMSFTATVSHEVIGTLNADLPQNLNISRRGQNARLSFQGVAGTVVGLQFAGVSSTPASRTLSFTVISPTGKTVFSGITSALGEYSATLRLTESGPYAVFVDPQYGAVASAQVTLISNAAASATIDGDGFPVATTVNGQSAYFTFTGTAGENLGLGISGLTLSAGTYVPVVIQRPDGVAIVNGAGCYASNNGCDFNLVNLPLSGVYSVVLYPAASGTMSFIATVSHEVIGTLNADLPQNLNISRRGQNARLSFQGAAGTVVGLQLAGVNSTPAGRLVAFTVTSPTGKTAFSATTSAYGEYSATLPLSETGTYTVFIDPQFGAAASMRVALLTAASSAITTDGSLRSISTSLLGESTYTQFFVAAGQSLRATISGLVFTPSSVTYASVYVLRPNGTYLIPGSTCSSSGGGCTVALNALSPGGTYSIVVVPNGLATMRYTLSIAP